MICRPATRLCRPEENIMPPLFEARLFVAPLFAPMLLLASPAFAAGPFQDTAALDRAVAAFTGKAIGEAGGARSVVDARLKLASCPTVSMSWRGASQDAVVVTCTGPEWRIFVPVRASAIAASGPAAAAPVATAPIKVAAVIKRGDPVTIAAGSPGFSITREGIAMADAGAGGRFLVKVDGTRAPVQAVAIEAGRATLPGWTE
jgi:flagella basal body P-ring formation protein FlgA